MREPTRRLLIKSNSIQRQNTPKTSVDTKVSTISSHESMKSEVSQCDRESSNSSSHDVEDGAIESKTSVNVISGEETKIVYRHKIVVLILLVGACVIVAVCVHTFIKQSENAEFEKKFEKDAATLMEGLGLAIARTLNPLDTLAGLLVSHASFANETWPFVTMPDFAWKLSKILPFTDAMMITTFPIVQPSERSQWETYTSQNLGWVNESIKLQDSWDKYTGPILYDWEPYDSIYGTDFEFIPENISRIMAPGWQMYPVVPRYTPYNWDTMSMVDTSNLYACLNTHKVVLTEPYMIPRPDNPEIQAESESWIEYYQDFIPSWEEPFEPIFDVIYPIIDDLNSVELSSAPDYKPEDHKMVGFLPASIYWRRLFENVLPSKSNGIIVNISSDCALSFAYQINGPNATYLGINNTYNKKYNHLLLSTKLVDIGKSNIVDSLYSGAAINEDYCPYTVYVYPSDEMKDDTKSNNAALYTAITCLVFLCIGIVFFLYDNKVEHRQKKVLSSAVRSSEIISSLFPSSVHDQIYASATPNGNEQDINLHASPIATLYNDTTVMFGDIKGFTAWSSTRSPTHVFQLLESLYGEFDKLSKVYGVFKVETVGDSYVAVVGLPKPRKNHALVLCKFAGMCLEKMAQVTKDLEEELGEDTLSLSLRIGLHSGPTTAGVLRGEKARFQIFGDTVNTASRMESTGDGGRIQISEATAELLIAADKSHWLTKRDDKVMAKGKGLMQTYWCEPGSREQSTKRSSLGSNHSC